MQNQFPLPSVVMHHLGKKTRLSELQLSIHMQVYSKGLGGMLSFFFHGWSVFPPVQAYRTFQ